MSCPHCTDGPRPYAFEAQLPVCLYWKLLLFTTTTTTRIIIITYREGVSKIPEVAAG